MGEARKTLSGSKRCTKCGVEENQSEFHRSPVGADGRTARCKTCRNADARAYRGRRKRSECLAEELGTRSFEAR